MIKHGESMNQAQPDLSLAALTSTIAVGTVGAMIIWIVPGFVALAAAQAHLDDQQVGYVASWDINAAAALMAVSVLLLRRLPWRAAGGHGARAHCRRKPLHGTVPCLRPDHCCACHRRGRRRTRHRRGVCRTGSGRQSRPGICDLPGLGRCRLRGHPAGAARAAAEFWARTALPRLRWHRRTDRHRASLVSNSGQCLAIDADRGVELSTCGWP